MKLRRVKFDILLCSIFIKLLCSLLFEILLKTLLKNQFLLSLLLKVAKLKIVLEIPTHKRYRNL